MIRQMPKRISDRAPNRKAMRPAVSMKNPSGTILISISVVGSKIHRSLVKNMWWNMMKYFVKLVDIIAASAAITAKNSPVPIQREEGSNVRRSAFERIINKSITTQTTRQIRRRAMAFKNSPCSNCKV